MDGTYCNLTNEMPLYGLVVGISLMEVLGISGAAGKWGRQAKYRCPDLRE